MVRSIGVVGLGYVGLPLVARFAEVKSEGSNLLGNVSLVGYDINSIRISELRSGQDNTGELTHDELRSIALVDFVDTTEGLLSCDFFIVCVPTPVDEHNRPDFGPLLRASEMLREIIVSQKEKGVKPTIVFESTVYPGATREVCIAEIEKGGLVEASQDFYYGYSPERINPGDRSRRLKDIVKVTSGCCTESSEVIDSIYSEIIEAGTYRAKSVEVAEAAKVIENTQRDINIAFVNELSMLFSKLDIDIFDVLDAARTKWNFLDFKPGLVGGHCIGVDPYYLTWKADQVGFHPATILSGRKINDEYPSVVSRNVVKRLFSQDKVSSNCSVLVLGFTFKENCSDTRNTKVAVLVNELVDAGVRVDIMDPYLEEDIRERGREYNLSTSIDEGKRYDAVILCVSHKEFLEWEDSYWERILKVDGFIYDIKGVLPRRLERVVRH